MIQHLTNLVPSAMEPNPSKRRKVSGPDEPAPETPTLTPALTLTAAPILSTPTANPETVTRTGRTSRSARKNYAILNGSVKDPDAKAVPKKKMKKKKKRGAKASAAAAAAVHGDDDPGPYIPPVHRQQQQKEQGFSIGSILEDLMVNQIRTSFKRVCVCMYPARAKSRFWSAIESVRWNFWFRPIKMAALLALFRSLLALAPFASTAILNAVAFAKETKKKKKRGIAHLTLCCLMNLLPLPFFRRRMTSLIKRRRCKCEIL